MTPLIVITLLIVVAGLFESVFSKPKQYTKSSKPRFTHTEYDFDDDNDQTPIMYTAGINMSAEDKETYLAMYEWQELREKVLKRDNYSCVLCSSPHFLNCHHTHYRYLGYGGKKEESSCITLCVTCHSNIHSKLGYHREGDYSIKAYKNTH